MGKIKRDSWAIIERIIRRYPESKEEYETYVEEIMASSSGNKIGIGLQEEVNVSSIVERKALKMNSAKMDRMKREINAVEYVYSGLTMEEQKILRKRYWNERWKNIPYTKIVGVSYSERQMKRIIYKIVSRVGTHLGEL